MKLKNCAMAVLAALPLVATSTVAAPTAAELQDRVYGSVFLEVYSPDQDKGVSQAWGMTERGDGYGINVGYRLTEHWSIRAEALRQELPVRTDSSKDISGNRAGLDVIYHLDNLPLYVGGGLRNITTGQSSSAANLVVGAEWFTTDRFALNIEASRFQGISKPYADAAIRVGGTYYFGAEPAVEPTPAPAPVVAPEPAPAPVVGDADQDGVTDDKDQCPNTPITDKVDTVGCSIFQETSVSIAIKAQFDNDSAVVKPEYHAEVEKLAAFLKRFPNTDVEIAGHASNVGKPAYNLKLSQRRADAIAEVLVSKFGIDRSRVKAVGYGVTKPKVSGNTAAAHAANRRIEGIVTASVKEAVQR